MNLTSDNLLQNQLSNVIAVAQGAQSEQEDYYEPFINNRSHAPGKVITASVPKSPRLKLGTEEVTMYVGAVSENGHPKKQEKPKLENKVAVRSPSIEY